MSFFAFMFLLATSSHGLGGMDTTGVIYGPGMVITPDSDTVNGIHDYTLSDYQILAGKGITTVRYNVYDYDFVTNDVVMTDLEDNLTWAKQCGLKVIINNMTGRAQLAAGTPEGIYTFWEYMSALWHDILDPDELFYEVCNEPGTVLGTNILTAAEWINYQNQAISVIRSNAPYNTILVTYYGNSNPYATSRFDTSALVDDNCIFSVHFYEPYNFTHQGSWWSSIYYPTNQLWPDENRVEYYKDNYYYWTKESFLDSMADKLATFTQSNGYRVVVTEFGQVVMGACPLECREAYYRDIVESAYVERGIPMFYQRYSGANGYRSVDDFLLPAHPELDSCLRIGASPVVSTNVIGNGDMEFANNGVASSWFVNHSSGDFTANLTMTSEPFNGELAQSIECTAISSGAVQYQQNNRALTGGSEYVLSAFMQTEDVAGDCVLQVKSASQGVLGQGSVQVPSEYRNRQVSAYVPETVTDGIAIIRFSEPGTLQVDKVRMCEIPNLIPDYGFEQGMGDWYLQNVDTGAPTWQLTPDACHGTNALMVSVTNLVSGGYIHVRTPLMLDIQKGWKYAIKANLKASQPVSVFLQLVRNGSVRSVPLSGEFELTTDYTECAVTDFCDVDPIDGDDYMVRLLIKEEGSYDVYVDDFRVYRIPHKYWDLQ